MGFGVVCISRALAAGGEVIGEAVAQRLRYRYVDDEIVTIAAERANVDAALIAAAEHRQPLVQRFLNALATASPAPLAYLTGQPLEHDYSQMVAPATPLSESHRALIREVIQDVAATGNAVIVAHAASMALAGRCGTLRVLVTASPKTRAQRLSTAGHSLTDAAAAAQIKESDRERRAYFKSFYGVHEELPTHYDLVINTDVLPPEQAVRIIVAAAES